MRGAAVFRQSDVPDVTIKNKIAFVAQKFQVGISQDAAIFVDFKMTLLQDITLAAREGINRWSI